MRMMRMMMTMMKVVVAMMVMKMMSVVARESSANQITLEVGNCCCTQLYLQKPARVKAMLYRFPVHYGTVPRLWALLSTLR